MIPRFMIVDHNPPETWGDCTRACVASIFEMQPEDVPHFAGGPEPDVPDANGEYPWSRKLRAWLEERGHAVLFFQINSAEGDWFTDELCPFHYIRGGTTRRGTKHDTVWYGSKMVHDPQWRDPVGIILDEYPHDVLVFVKK